MGIAELSGSNSVVKGVKGNAETDYRTGLVNLTPANIGAAAASHTHSYLPLSGGTLSGLVYMQLDSGDVGYFAKRTDTGTQVWMGVGSGGTNHGIYSNKLGKWMVYGDASDVYISGLKMTTAAAGRTSLACMYAVSANGYYGMGRPDANTSDWIRTTSSGLIPYSSASAGSSQLGTSSWPFKEVWSKAYKGHRTVLYNNTTGGNGAITLSASAANYNHMRIHYRNASGQAAHVNQYNTTDVFTPNGKYVNLAVVGPDNTKDLISMNTRLSLISGTSINNARSVSGNLGSSGGASGVYNEIYIVRVEAWNE